MNISELARQLNTEPQVLRDVLPKMGIHIGEKAIQIDDATVPRAIEAWKLYIRRETLKAKLAERIKQSTTVIDKPAASDQLVIKLPPSLTVTDFAKRVNLDVARVMIKLMQEGVMAAMNQKIDYDTAHIVAEDFGIVTEMTTEESVSDEQSLNVKETIKQENHLVPRPPVVVVMGHVDHGKTSLLDVIRKTNIVAEESGAITQHIGAYQVKVDHPHSHDQSYITFIDTPGHEAFSGMRSRGGQVADIAVLVIAADDKIQPQTIESIQIIQKENLGLIVAINKIDKPNADPEAIKKQLSEINLLPEDWGGDVICVPVSAKQGLNLDQLLENILILAEISEFKANPDGELIGTVIESHVDKGLGPVPTVIIQNGTLKSGDYISCGLAAGRLKGLLDFRGTPIASAGPSTPVQLLGLKCLPQSGDVIKRLESSRELKRATKKYHVLQNVQFSTKNQEDQVQLKIHLKADVSGTLEALTSEIAKIKHELVDIKIVRQGLGNFTESDVQEAQADGAVLIGFKIEPSSNVKRLISTTKVICRTYQVIYKLLDDLRNSLEELLPPKIVEEDTGEAVALAVFTKTSDYMIVGGQVKSGHVIPDSRFRIFRDNEIIGEAKVIELQTNHQLVKKVQEPQEFGLRFSGDTIVKEGDILKFYTVREEKRKL